MTAHGGLSAQVRVARHAFEVDVSLDVAPGEVVALLGPNGAGKTTVLRALAGLLPLSGGEITLAGDVLDNPADGRFVSPERRRTGVVFQDHLLFGRLSALDNVAFGLRARGARRRLARAAALPWLHQMRLGEQADVPGVKLSGGQAQRVALARALAVEPRLLLLDEPLAALDAATRMHVRAELRRHLGSYPGPVVLVTHDVLDAMVLAARVVVLERGSVVQSGPPAEVARAPRTDYVARLVGLNLYRGTVVSRRGGAGRVALTGGGEVAVADCVVDAGADVFVAVPPSAVALYAEAPGGSPRNVWSGRVAALEHHGDVVRVVVDGEPAVLADVTASAVADLAIAPGRELFAVVKATEARTYPA